MAVREHYRAELSEIEIEIESDDVAFGNSGVVRSAARWCVGDEPIHFAYSAPSIAAPKAAILTRVPEARISRTIRVRSGR